MSDRQCVMMHAGMPKKENLGSHKILLSLITAQNASNQAGQTHQHNRDWRME